MEFEIRKGTPADLEQYIELIRDVRQGMGRKDWLYLDPPELVWQMMTEGMMEFWIAMAGNTMAAAFSILIPGADPCNYGYSLDFSEAELHRVINLDTIAVRPEFRGKGLHKRLLWEAERGVARRKDPILLCTVHPENRFSLQNFLDTGYAIEKQLEMYGSVRYVLRKDLT